MERIAFVIQGLATCGRVCYSLIQSRPIALETIGCALRETRPRREVRFESIDHLSAEDRQSIAASSTSYQSGRVTSSTPIRCTAATVSAKTEAVLQAMFSNTCGVRLFHADQIIAAVVRWAKYDAIARLLESVDGHGEGFPRHCGRIRVNQTHRGESAGKQILRCGQEPLAETISALRDKSISWGNSPSKRCSSPTGV